MVLRRKLPSAMTSSEGASVVPTPKENQTVDSSLEKDELASEVDPEIETSSVFDDVVDETPLSSKDMPQAKQEATPAEGKVEEDSPSIPLAPESKEESSPFDVHDDMNDSLHFDAPMSSSFAEDSLENSYASDETPLSADASIPAEDSEEKPAAGGWSLEDLIQEPEPFSFDEQEEAREKEETKSNLPPWQQGATGGEPPILPGLGDDLDASEPNNKLRVFAGLALVAALCVGVYYAFVEEKDQTTEKLARITNALEEVSEKPDEVKEVFPEVEERRMGDLQSEPVLTPEEDEAEISVALIEDKGTFADFPAEGETFEDDVLPENAVEDVLNKAKENLAEAKVSTEESSSGGTVVEFLDVDEGEVDEMITGEDAPEVPEEMNNFFERLRSEIQKAEQQRTGEAKVVETEKGETKVVEVPKVVREEDNHLKVSDLEAELAEYRRVLAGGSGESPKKVTPSEFFNGPDGDVQSNSGAIPAPARSGDTAAPIRGAEEQAKAASMYGANPYNLPVVPEPSQQPVQKVRTLDDYDVTMFVPEEKRIRMPKNIQPSLNNADFPPVYLLSLVPGQGVIAQNRGVQGVLMIGESVDSWELVTVATGYAEFRKGKRRHVLTLDGIR